MPALTWSVSFRGDAKHRTRNLEIPGLVLAHHPGMTEFNLRNDVPYRPCRRKYRLQRCSASAAAASGVEAPVATAAHIWIST